MTATVGILTDGTKGKTKVAGVSLASISDVSKAVKTYDDGRVVITLVVWGKK